MQMEIQEYFHLESTENSLEQHSDVITGKLELFYCFTHGVALTLSVLDNRLQLVPVDLIGKRTVDD